jgi:hypothetical protein
MVCCCDATASSIAAKVAKSSHIFQAVAIKCHSSIWNLLFGPPGLPLSKNPHDIKENDVDDLDFALGEFGLFHWESCCVLSGS